jgi:hypothetical protein
MKGCVMLSLSNRGSISPSRRVTVSASNLKGSLTWPQTFGKLRMIFTRKFVTL